MKGVGSLVSLVVGGVSVVGVVDVVEVSSNEDALGELVFHKTGKEAKVGDRLVGGEIGVDVDVEDMKVDVGARGME